MHSNKMLKITAQISIIWLATAATGMLNTPLEAQTTEGAGSLG